MINYYVDEFGTLRIYKGTQCLAYISHCENSTTQEIQNLVDEVIIESGYSQYLGDFVKYNDEIFFVADDNSHYKVNGAETITADEITGTLGQLLDEVDLPADLHNQVQDLYDRAAELLDGKTYAKTEAKYDDSLESLFESISQAIDSTVQICNLEYSNLVSHLFDFGCEAMTLIKPCLYNQKAFDIVDMISEVLYWTDAYRDRYSDEELVRECCQSIVFNLFCIIDGVSSNNDFKIEKTVFDESLQNTELHALWCGYLNKQ